ncbi:hypothetical protein HYX17_03850 [Candidatus Woesearchaeota archaeon]|nr:hypothetical protein [Candidatus Woesearchaeota archaeon]
MLDLLTKIHIETDFNGKIGKYLEERKIVQHEMDVLKEEIAELNKHIKAIDTRIKREREVEWAIESAKS